MDTIRSLLTAAAVNRHDSRRRGERNAWIGFHDPLESILYVGGSLRHEEIREDILFSCVNDQLKYPEEGAVVLVSEPSRLRLLETLYAGNNRFVWFPDSASYNPFSGLSEVDFSAGMDDLLSKYCRDTPGLGTGAHSVLHLLIDLMQRMLPDCGDSSYFTYSNFEILTRGLAFSSANEYVSSLESLFGQPIPDYFLQNLNRQWTNGVPALTEFCDALRRQFSRVRSQGEKYSLYEAVRERKIAVLCLDPSLPLLRGAVCRELGFLSAEGVPFSLYGLHASLDETMMQSCFAGLMGVPHFCLIGTKLSSVGIDPNTLLSLRPAVGCFGADGKDAGVLAEFYNANYISTQSNLHLGHGIGVGITRAQMPMLSPDALLEANIPYGGVYLLMPGSHRRIVHLFIR